MKKIATYGPYLALLIFMLFLSQPCNANPIYPAFPYGYPNAVSYYLVLWLVSPVIESAIIFIILKLIYSYSKNPAKPIILVILLNLITIPITNFIAIGLRQNGIVVYLAEIFPLIVEFWILFWLFNSLYKGGSISHPINSRSTLLITLGVNLVTFFFGLFYFNYWPYPRLEPLQLLLIQTSIIF